MRAPKIYSRLLSFYPATFRERYEQAIERQFQDEYRDAATSRERRAVWLRAMRDLAVSIPAETARELGQDLKYAARQNRRGWPAALLTVAALGLSIGASTGVFSVLNALLLRTLPFRAPEQLVQLRLPPVSPIQGRAAFEEWVRETPYLADAAVFSNDQMNLAVEHGALRVKVAETSANFFSILGTAPVLGRAFLPAEEEPGSPAVGVISHGLWQQAYGGDPGITGRTITLNGANITVVGVAPPRFDFPDKTAVWTATAYSYEVVPRRGAFFLDVVARLKADVSVKRAQSLFLADVQRLAPAGAKAAGGPPPRVIPLREKLSGPVGTASWVLAGIILLVLLAACANLAHLLLSRAIVRRHEFALRASLGASRARIVQQLITEALALTASGAVLGLLFADWASRLASSVAPPAIASQEYTVLDWRVVAFALALAAITAVVFGVLPAFAMGPNAGRAGRSQLASRDRATKAMRFALIATQAGLTVALLATSATLGRTFLKLLDMDLGFRTGNTVAMSVSLQGAGYKGGEASWRYYAAALERLRSVGGVEAAGGVAYVPLAEHFYMGSSFRLDSGESASLALMNGATPDYFRAMGTRFLAGGDFAAAGGERAVIVNEAFARATGLGSRIVGRRLLSPWGNGSYRIVGVVETMRFGGPASDGAPMVYWAVEEEPGPALTLVARVKGNAADYVARCRDAVRSVDPAIPVYDAATLDERLAMALVRPRFFLTAIVTLTAIAFLLALAGTFGSTAHAVAQRTPEFGVRMALGASYGRVRALLVRQTFVPAAVGSAAGVALAAAGGRYLGHLLAHVRGLAPSTCALAAGFLLLGAVFAAWAASARLRNIDPAVAIRAE